LLPFGTIVNFFLLPFVILSEDESSKGDVGTRNAFSAFPPSAICGKNEYVFIHPKFYRMPVSFCATRYTIVWHFSVPFTVCHFAEICCHSGSSVEQNDFMAAFSNRMKP
jgi:hypothetical protein